MREAEEFVASLARKVVSRLAMSIKARQKRAFGGSEGPWMLFRLFSTALDAVLAVLKSCAGCFASSKRPWRAWRLFGGFWKTLHPD